MRVSNYRVLFTLVLLILLTAASGCTGSDDAGTEFTITAEKVVYNETTGVPLIAEELPGYTFLTEEFAPMNYMEDGELKGISAELLGLILEDLGVDKNSVEITVMEWPEAYRLVRENEKTVLFSMARTGGRESLFKWAGPIMNNTNALFAKKSSEIAINSPGDLEKYTIGAVNETSSFSLLGESGYPVEKIRGADSPEEAFALLESGDIDMWATGEVAGLYYMKEMAEDPGDYDVVWRFEPYEFYYAFNRETPDEVIELFRSALDDAKRKTDKDGNNAFDRILVSYI